MSTWKKIIGTQETEFRVGLAGPKLVKGTAGLEVKDASGALTDVKAATFSGSGAGLTNLDAAAISGTVASADVAYSVDGANVVGQVADAASADVALSVAGANVSGQVADAASADVALSVAGANVSGQVADAASADVALSVDGANVVGTVGSASVAYSVDAANIVGQVANAASADVALSVAGANVTGEVSFAATANAVAGANVSGEVSFAAVANSVAGANVSGTVAYANVAYSIDGANVSGNVGGANIAYALSTDAANVSITGGTAGQFLQTDANGSVTWATVDATGIQNGTSSVDIPTADGNIVLTVAGFEIAAVSAGGMSLTGNLDITGNVNVTGNLNYQNVTDMVVGDPLIYIGANNAADLFDLGLVASYTNGTEIHTGLVRDHTTGAWTFFDMVTDEPTTTVNFAQGGEASVKLSSLTATGSIEVSNESNIAGTHIAQGQISNAAGGGMEVYSTDYAQLNYNGESWVWVDSSGVHFESTGGQADFDTNGDLTLPGKVTTETLTVNTYSELGDVANVSITGGSDGEVLTTNGSGVLSWTAIPSTADALKTVIVDFQYNLSSGSSWTIPAGSIINEVIVIVDSAFNGTATVKVGNMADPAAYVTDSDTLLSLTDRFEFGQSAAALSADDSIVVTVTGGGATTGTGRVIVSYSTPI